MATLATKAEKIKIIRFDSSCFRSKDHFEEHGTPNYLVFQPKDRYFLKKYWCW